MKKRNIIIFMGQFCAVLCAAGILWGMGYMLHKQQVSDKGFLSDTSDNPVNSDDSYSFDNSDISEDLNLCDSSEASGISNTSDTLNTSADLDFDVIETGQSIAGQQIATWNLTLVNPWNPLPESYSINLVMLMNGQSVDARCYPDLQEMMDDCRAAGLSPYICSSYRSLEKQNQLFEDNVASLMAQGYLEADARSETAKNVALPGTSEHQLGLAVDIVDKNYQVLDEKQEYTAVQQWLMENSWKYGWILRYPEDKSDITGITYEPWHYRYVGKEAASVIYQEGICLEEYMEDSSVVQNWG